MYRDRDPRYMRAVGEFVDRFRDHDLVVMATYNFLHPEILVNELKKPIKVLGFVDDPYSTYVRGVPYLWAFDGAFYVSPSYDERTLMPEALERWGCDRHYWYPIALKADKAEPTAEFFGDRSVDLVYVGAAKVDRLAELKKHFGSRFVVHGRWAHKGYFGYTRALAGRPLYPSRVTPITEAEKLSLYRSAKIGIDLHMSDRPMETGNIRMYEVPAQGMMLLCDEAGRNAHAQIFKPGVEAVYYSSIADAIEKAEYYLAHDEERIAIARAGWERVWRDYVWEDQLLRFLQWATSLPKRTSARAGPPVSVPA
jgi:spore maturation protein CgeB